MEKRPYRSLFWPVILIGVGIIWLLGNFNIIPAANISMLLNLWPVILIVIGLDILFARRSPLAGAVIAALAIILVIAVLAAGPALGLPAGPTLQSRTINEPIGGAQSAEISLDLSSIPTRVGSSQDRANLFEGQIDYYGALDYNSTGNPNRRISLSHHYSGNVLTWDMFANAQWKIGLSPDVPINLIVDGGSGSSQFDLSGLNLTAFELDQGSGSFTLSLPASAQSYTARIKGGSGSLRLDLPGSGNLTVRLNGASGSLNLNVPSGTAVRLEVVNDGSGSVNVPSWLNRVSGSGKQGTWESSNYNQAANKLVILCDDLGSGSFNLR